MRWERPPGVILKYYLYSATTHPGFYWPVFTLFLLYRDVTYTQIGLLFTLEAVLVVAGEVPTGYVGDRIGRRNSLVISQALWMVASVGFLVSHTFPAFVLTFVAIAFAGTFSSGSGDAWLYDILEERLDEGEFTRVRGRGGAVNRWVSALTMIASGFLYVRHPTYPFVAALALTGFGLVVLLSMPKNVRYADGDAERFTVLDALPLIREKISEPPLRSFVLYMGLFFAIGRAADDYIQPITVNVLETGVASVGALGLPAEASLGFFYAAFTVASAVASYYAGDVEERLGTAGAVLLVPALSGVFFLIPVAVPLAALPLFFVMKSSRAVMQPIANGYVNEHTESVGRATVLSAAAMVYALVRTPFMLVVGVTADLYTPILGVATLGGLFLVGATLSYLWEAPVSTAEETPAAAD